MRSDPSRTPSPLRLVLLAAAALAVLGCGAPRGGLTGSASTPTPRREVTPAPFNLAVAVPGAPNPADPTFLADQERLYDSRQFSDPAFYPLGYHWRIDPGIGPHGVSSAHAAYDSFSNQWIVAVFFTPAAAEHVAADTEAAYQATKTSPANPPAASHIAFFVGNEVVSAPYVQSPSSKDAQIQGGFTEQQADDLARAIIASAQAP
jgi:hypothetical protein